MPKIQMENVGVAGAKPKYGQTQHHPAVQSGVMQDGVTSEGKESGGAGLGLPLEFPLREKPPPRSIPLSPGIDEPLGKEGRGTLDRGPELPITKVAQVEEQGPIVGAEVG